LGTLGDTDFTGHLTTEDLSMPAPVPLPIRKALWHRWEQGATTTELSHAFDLPTRTVRNLLQRGRERGATGLAPDYMHLPDPPPAPNHPAFAPAAQLRQEHPDWGAGLIRIYLEDQGIQPLPALRTLQLWFQRAGLTPAPPGRRPTISGARATAPHEIWEIDAAEEILLGDGT
jgi:transposase